jgi:hypothetical protein
VTTQQPNPQPNPKPNPFENMTISQEQLLLLQETTKLIKWKMSILEKLETKPLMEQLLTGETVLAQVLENEATFKGQNRGLLAGAGDDCLQVKEKLAMLWTEAPPLNAGGKPATQTDKEAWLRLQRTANKELAGIITRQLQVLGVQEQFRIDIERTKRKLDSTLAVIRLKTAQIEFLGRSI